MVVLCLMCPDCLIVQLCACLLFNNDKQLAVILEKLEKADNDREKILLELDDLSKIIAENRIKIIQLEQRVDKLDEITGISYSDVPENKELLTKIAFIEVNTKWIIGSIICLVILYFTLIFNLI